MENKPILEIGKRDLEQTTKIVVLKFLSSESRPQLGLSSSLIPNPSHIFHISKFVMFHLGKFPGVINSHLIYYICIWLLVI